MSQPSRPRARGPAQRRRRDLKLEQPIPLEDRRLPAPVVAIFPLQATFTAAATPTNADLGTVTVTEAATAATTGTAAPITSVAELTPNTSFGGDIVNIEPGPGGVFGSDVYAISRGGGGNPDAINRPGVIYRVNPATGKASVFFDLNTVLSQTDPTDTTSPPAANSLGASTGLVNWYSMTFDPEGSFDGTPSLFVSSVDRSDPNKNIIFQISPSGTLIGVFVTMTDGLASLKFNLNPTAILIPPVQEQNFLTGLTNGHGMIAGSGIGTSTGGTFAALFFDASAYSPGQTISNATLPNGVSETNLGLPVATDVLTNFNSVVANVVNTGPIVGLTASNLSYGDQIFSVFTDFGTPAGGGINAAPGYSGVQQSADGTLLIGESTTLVASAPTDAQPAATTPFRRFYGTTFDQYGYFSQNLLLTASSSTTSGTTGGTTFTLGSNGPAYAGSLFVSDLASGLYVSVTPVAPFPTTPILVPVQGSGTISVTTNALGVVVPVITDGNTTGGTNDFGGRILRITPNGVVNTFAYGFDTSGAQDASSFVDSTLSIGFSSDGTILYASDDQGIWQFKTTADLADSTSGSLIGLSDLRALGVPYDGQNAAVAVVDTGVDGTATSFRGRVATGTNIPTGGPGNQDLAPAAGPSTSGATGGAGGGGGGWRHRRHRRRHREHCPQQYDQRPRNARRRRRGPVRPGCHDRTDQYLLALLHRLARHRRHGNDRDRGRRDRRRRDRRRRNHRGDRRRHHRQQRHRCDDPDALRRPSVPHPAPLRQRPDSARTGQPRGGRGLCLRHAVHVRDRGPGLQAVPSRGHRAQEPVPQAAQGGDRQHRGGRTIRGAAPGLGGHELGHDDRDRQHHGLPGRQQRHEHGGWRREGHLPARRAQRGRLGHGRLLLPVRPDPLDGADRHALWRDPRQARPGLALRQQPDHRRHGELVDDRRRRNDRRHHDREQ